MSFSRLMDQGWATARKYALPVGLFLIACASPLSAQQDQPLSQPKFEAKVIVGSAVFGEDIEHKMVGAAVRVYAAKRFSIEPEYLYLRHSVRDQDQLVQLNVVYDFTDPTKRAVVYGIAGGGVLYHKGRFVSDNPFTGVPDVFDNSFTTWTASVGGGAKIYLTKRLFVAPELRFGREPTVRASINVGYVFAGRR